MREGCFEVMRIFRGMVPVALLAGLVFGTGCETSQSKTGRHFLPTQAKAPEDHCSCRPRPADPQAQDSDQT